MENIFRNIHVDTCSIMHVHWYCYEGLKNEHVSIAIIIEIYYLRWNIIQEHILKPGNDLKIFSQDTSSNETCILILDPRYNPGTI